MNVVDLTGESPEEFLDMTEQVDLSRVNFPQSKHSIRHYAGRYTPVLEKKYFAWVDEGKPHDAFCIVCLKNSNDGKNVIKCKTCSRVYHSNCLSTSVYPLCVRRLWDEEPPFRPASGILGGSDDDQVKLWRRHTKWNERMKEANFARWVTFYDDGSLTSDRFLIKLMGTAPTNKFKGFKALREQAESSEVGLQYRNSALIRKAEIEVDARKEGLSTLRKKWVNNTMIKPYIEATEDAISVLETAIDLRRSVDGQETVEPQKTQTKQLIETSEKLLASQNRVRDLEMSNAANGEHINSLTANIKHLHEALAEANTRAQTNTEDATSGATATVQTELNNEAPINDSAIVRMLSLCLNSSARNHPTPLPILARAGFEQTHIDRLMQLDAFKALDARRRHAQEQDCEPQHERDPPLRPSAKRRTRSEAAREDTKAMKKERLE